VHHVRSATPGVSGRRRHRLAGGAGRRPTGQALLAKNFGLPEATFANFPKQEVYFARGKPPPATYPGGREWRVDSSRFPIAKTITGVILDLDPGALRTLHWHPNADEWQYVIEGEVSVTLFGSHGRYRTERLEKGTSATSRRAMATRSRMSAAGRRAS
jgi:oxalate decarboxylase/phosphoglucose isomerase-like protein (cupin superfamily)